MKFILGKKLGMMQIFEPETKAALPVTLVEAGPVFITQVKTKDKDGYSAVQVGFSKKKKLTKPLRGHLKNLGNLHYLREFRINQGEEAEFEKGKEITVEIFAKGEKVAVSSFSKGRGFAGVVKRHGFHGGPKTHGQKHSLRRPGSIGATTPQRVIKGTRMAGHMGAERVTVKGLKVVDLDPEKNILFIKGAIPGHFGSLVEIKGYKT
ncbi:MAG: 50S ribosomal protein L3 [Patescibacteria group bacterium]